MPEVGYQEFWRAVTRDGRLPCELEGLPCHRCDGTGLIDKPAEQLSLIGSAMATRACTLCKQTGVMACDGIIDAHHYVPKRRLVTVQAKQDVRNGVTLCRAHHDLVEQGFVVCPRPALLEFFLAEHEVPSRHVPVAA